MFWSGRGTSALWKNHILFVSRVWFKIYRQTRLDCKCSCKNNTFHSYYERTGSNYNFSNYLLKVISITFSPVPPPLFPCIHITTPLLLEAHVPTSGCQFVAQPAFHARVEWESDRLSHVKWWIFRGRVMNSFWTSSDYVHLCRARWSDETVSV